MILKTEKKMESTKLKVSFEQINKPLARFTKNNNNKKKRPDKIKMKEGMLQKLKRS